MTAKDDAHELPLQTLIDAYRTGRAHLIALEQCLVKRGFIKCPKCRRLHPEIITDRSPECCSGTSGR